MSYENRLDLPCDLWWLTTGREDETLEWEEILQSVWNQKKSNISKRDFGKLKNPLWSLKLPKIVEKIVAAINVI